MALLINRGGIDPRVAKTMRSRRELRKAVQPHKARGRRQVPLQNMSQATSHIANKHPELIATLDEVGQLYGSLLGSRLRCT